MAIKSGESFHIPDRHFIGEVSFVPVAPPSASVTVVKGGGSRGVEPVAPARRLTRNADLERAFEALLSRDVAVNVAASAQRDVMRAKRNGETPWTALAAAPSMAPGGAGGPIRATA